MRSLFARPYRPLLALLLSLGLLALLLVPRPRAEALHRFEVTMSAYSSTEDQP